MFYKNGDIARGDRFALTNTQYYKLRIYNQDAENPAILIVKVWLERQL